MCGLLGYFSRSPADEDFEWMVRNIGLLSHRGPDSEGIWQRQGGDVGLAHRRLAVIDVSDQGMQPMATPDESVILVFNGNIYNYLELRAELQAAGAVFRSNCDTEVLLHAYCRWGDAFVHRLFGFFAFAIWDERKRRLLLGRDRLGEKPLYYSCASERIMFASEPVALPKGEIERTAFADFLVYGFVPAPKTMWSNVYKLEPAHLLAVNIGSEGLRTRCWRYWQPAIGGTRLGTESEMLDGLDCYCREAAERTTRSDVPLGGLLSGGVDSSGVVALISKVSGRRMHTYTVGFGSPDHDELPWARQVAERYRTIHREIECASDEAEAQFSRLARIYGEPFDDTSQLACVCVFQAAARYCKVILTGDGADELFCGYTKYTRLKRLLMLRGAFPDGLWRRFLGLLHSRHRSGTIAENQLYRAIASNRELMCELSAIAVRPREVKDFLTPDLRDYDPRCHIEKRLRDVENLAPLDQLRYLDVVFKLPEQMLFKVDRASMAASVEARAFYLYHPLVEFALSLPSELLVQHDGKYLLKRLLERYVPKDNLYRKKHGFGLRQTRHEDWLDDSMRRYLLDAAGIDYGPVLIRGNSIRAKRLYFGARSLYEWLRSQDLPILHDAFYEPVSIRL
ncbi:MAG: asparagine synthase (glutamine-hydrolyzing) [Gammaproteobacteria bacterium]